MVDMGKTIATSAEIKRKALELGFLGCGIIPVNVFDEYAQSLDERVKSFPESKAFYDPLYNLVNQPDNAKSIIVCTNRYNKYKVPGNLDRSIGKVYLFDSRISYTQEYRENSEFETYIKLLGMNVHTGGVPSRLAAAKAGLGKFGRNNFLYDQEHGSYIWINAWVVDKELEYDDIKNDTLHPSCDESCQKCVKSCPTKALSGSFSMDRGGCVAQLSCYAKDLMDENTMPEMGTWLYGCDACQDACPLNRDKFTETEDYPLLAMFEEYLKPERILEMDENTYKNILNPRFWYAGEDKLWLWKCNALRSMINSGEEKYHPLIKKACNDEDARIKKIAQWGLKRLNLR